LKGKEKGILALNQIDQIKELQRQGTGPKEIGERLSVDRNTVARYMARIDFGQKVNPESRRGSRLDPFRTKIDEWLEEDRRTRFKQRHAAKRLHERLGEEFLESYDCSYPLVQRYIPHWYVLVLEGGFTRFDRFVYLPIGVDEGMLRVWQKAMLALFSRKKLIDQARADMLTSWQHSGFSYRKRNQAVRQG